MNHVPDLFQFLMSNAIAIRVNCEAEEVNGLIYVSLWEQEWGGEAWWYLHGTFSLDSIYSMPNPPLLPSQDLHISPLPLSAHLQDDDCKVPKSVGTAPTK
jgi:hypothetical protein